VSFSSFSSLTCTHCLLLPVSAIINANNLIKYETSAFQHITCQEPNRSIYVTNSDVKRKEGNIIICSPSLSFLGS
jgi:hypothetical protein